MKTVTGARNHDGLVVFTLIAVLSLAFPCASAAGWTKDFRVTDLRAWTSPSSGRNIACTPDGSIHIVYNARFNGNYEICHRVFGGMDWSERERLTFNSGCSSGEGIAADTYGNLHVFWHDHRDGNAEIYHKCFDGSSWGADERLTDDAGISGNPSAAVDENGKIHLVWHDSRDGIHRIFYKFFDGSSWSLDYPLSSDSTDSRYPSIAVGPGGTVHLVWYESPGSAYDNEIYYRMFDGLAWADGMRLSEHGESSHAPCIAVDRSGKVHVVWAGARTGIDEIYYKTFDGTAWSDIYGLSSAMSPTGSPVITVGENGYIHVIWCDNRDGLPGVCYRVFDGTDWGQEERLTDAGDEVKNPSISVAQDAAVHIVWNEHYSNRWGVGWKRSFEGDLDKPEILSIEPSSWFSGEVLGDTEISGNNFAFPIWVWLERGGESDVVAQGIRVLSADSIICKISLEGVELGFWDVIVENADGKTDTLASAFEVMPIRIWEDDVRLTEDAAGSYTGAGNSIASDMDGNIHVVWADDRDGVRRVYYRLNDGSHWYPPERLTNSSTNAWEPVLAADALGQVHVVWHEHRGSSYDICYRRRSPEGWDPGVWLTGNVGMSVYPAVTADGDGNVYVAWSNNRYGNFEIYARVFDGTAWGEPTRLSRTSAYSTHPVLAAGPDGNIHLAWQEKYNLGSEIIYGMYDGDRWGHSERLMDDSKEVQDPSLCVAPDSSVHLVWSYGSGGGSILYEVVKDQTGWHEAVRVTEKWARACHPSVVAGGGGRIHVVWEDRRSQEHPGWPEPEIYWKTRDGDLWGPEERITSGPGEPGKPSVAIDPAGNIHIVYQDDRDGNYEIYYARRPMTCGPPPVITESHPERASNMSRVAVHIFGADFREDALVWLEKPGEPKRRASSTEKVSPSYVKCEFRLNGAATGPWDLHLKNPDLQRAVLANAITIYDTPWGEETRVSFDPAGSATPRNNCRAVIREDGGVIHAVWQDARHGDNEIYYRRWDGSAWGVETRLTEATGNSRDASIVCGPDGDLHVCWNDDRDGAWEVYYKRFDGQSWGEDLRLSPGDGFTSEFPCLTVDASGNPFVFYGDTRHGPWQIYCSRWDGRMQIEQWVEERLTATDANARYPTATSDSRGRVYVFWADRGDGNFHIYSDRWTGSSWKGNWRLPCDPGMLVNPTCACDNLGRVMVVWRDTFYPTKLSAMVKDGGWVDTGPIGTWDSDPSLCGDGQGRFHLVYDLHFDNIVAYRTYSDSWSGVTEVNSVASAVKPFVAADAHGHVAVVWKDTRDGNSEIYLRRWEGDVESSGVAQAGAGDPEFGLALVSPNPGVGSVRMQFALATCDDARLSVFDIRGRLVWSKDLRRPGTGMYSVVWDCSDQSGRSVAPGVYLLRLDSGRRSASAKLVILR